MDIHISDPIKAIETFTEIIQIIKDGITPEYKEKREEKDKQIAEAKRLMDEEYERLKLSPGYKKAEELAEKRSSLVEQIIDINTRRNGVAQKKHGHLLRKEYTDYELCLEEESKMKKEYIELNAEWNSMPSQFGGFFINDTRPLQVVSSDPTNKLYNALARKHMDLTCEMYDLARRHTELAKHQSTIVSKLLDIGVDPE